jgi:hypothetical protein
VPASRRAVLAICVVLLAAPAVLGIVRFHRSPAAVGFFLVLLCGPWLAVLALRRRA